MEKETRQIVSQLVDGLFSDGYSEVFGEILDAIGIDDDEERDRAVNALENMVKSALSKTR